MLAGAIASGNPLHGATLMFAFTLGTSPVFFVVSYLATRLGSTLEKYFMKFVAISVLILAFLTIYTGLNLLGWQNPFAATTAANASFQTTQLPNSIISTASAYQTPEPSQLLTQGDPAGLNDQFTEVSLEIVNTGYQPEVLSIPANKPVRLTLTSQDVYSCSLAFVIPSQNLEVMLQPTDQQVVELPAFASGEKIPFSCSMGMYTGMIQVK